MRPGILVVYLVGDEDAALLDLHLAQIRRCTSVPYTIFAATNRLSPRLRGKLQQYPEVKVCDCPDTDLRGRDEHAYYLEYLTRTAIADGVTHLVTLHVDSFPIAEGWERQLAEKVSNGCAFAVMDHKYTACLFFTREFYLRHRPEYRVSREEAATPAFRQLEEEERFSGDSGIGFLLKARTAGLGWHVMRRTAADDDGFGEVHDGLMFHFGGAARMAQEPVAYLRYTNVQVGCIRLLRAAMRLCPRPLADKLRARHPRLNEWLAVKHHRVHAAQAAARLKRKLLSDPAAYLRKLQRNSPRCA